MVIKLNSATNKVKYSRGILCEKQSNVWLKHNRKVERTVCLFLIQPIVGGPISRFPIMLFSLELRNGGLILVSLCFRI